MVDPLRDPDDPEDVLKRDADPDTGLGGDDDYDQVRYALASRPRKSKEAPPKEPLRAFDPEVLKAEVESKYIVRNRSQRKKQRPIDPSYGVF